MVFFVNMTKRAGEERRRMERRRGEEQNLEREIECSGREYMEGWKVHTCFGTSVSVWARGAMLVERGKMQGVECGSDRD